jgi:hypothetical protein
MQERKREMKNLKKLLIIVLALVMISGVAADATTVKAASGYGFKSNGVTVKPGGDAKKFIKANKKWIKSTKNSKSCVANSGYDVTRKYKYFTIITLADKKNGYGKLESISITNKSVETPEGLKCGDDESQIKECYSKAKKSGIVYTVSKGKTKLVITVKDETVTEIEYLYTGSY